MTVWQSNWIGEREERERSPACERDGPGFLVVVPRPSPAGGAGVPGTTNKEYRRVGRGRTEVERRILLEEGGENAGDRQFPGSAPLLGTLTEAPQGLGRISMFSWVQHRSVSVKSPLGGPGEYEHSQEKY